jgi:hypothetical protein
VSVKATFQADFQSFDTAVRKAQVSLTGFEQDAHKVEARLNRVSDAFSGRKVITDATLAAEAIERMGGVSKLTQGELKRLTVLLDQAADKSRRMGIELPASLEKMSKAAKAAGALDKVGTSLRQVEGAASALGVSLPPSVGALSDLATFASSGAVSLAALGPVLAVVGTAFASLKLGKVAGEWSGLTDRIADGTAALLGWGDAIGERAAAKADILARASRAVGQAITDVNVAIVINQREADGVIAKNTGAAAAFEQEAKAAAKAAAEIDRITENNRDKFVTLARQWVAATHAQQEAELKGWQEVLAKRTEAEEAWHTKRQAHADRDRQFTAEYVQALKAVQEADLARLQTEVAIRKETEATTLAMRAQRLEAEAIARSIGSTVEYDLSTNEGLERFQRQNPGATVNAPAGYFQSHSLADAVREGYVRFAYAGQQGGYALSGLGTMRGGGGPSPSRGMTVTNVIHVNGVIDQQSKDAITTAASAGVYRRVVTGGYGGW